jgi:hypothetical protein
VRSGKARPVLGKIRSGQVGGRRECEVGEEGQVRSDRREEVR